MTKILPFSSSEQAEIRRLLRKADPARDLTPQDLDRIERLTMDALDKSSYSDTVWSMLYAYIEPCLGIRWPAAAFGAVLAGIMLGNTYITPIPVEGRSNLIAIATAEAWPQDIDENLGDSP